MTSGRDVVEDAQRLAAVGRLAHGRARALEQLAHEPTHVGVVVHHEDARPLHPGALCAV